MICRLSSKEFPFTSSKHRRPTEMSRHFGIVFVGLGGSWAGGIVQHGQKDR